jgi:hypothetical protein
MKLMRIGCIGISDESLRTPREGPRGKRIVAMSLGEHVLSSTCGVCE